MSATSISRSARRRGTSTPISATAAEPAGRSAPERAFPAKETSTRSSRSCRLSPPSAKTAAARSGAAAANSLTSVDFNGTSPNQSYAGTPNEYVQRMSAILKPSLEAYTAAGGADQTLSGENTTTGSLLEKDFFTGQAAAEFEYSSPCYEL